MFKDIKSSVLMGLLDACSSSTGCRVFGLNKFCILLYAQYIKLNLYATSELPSSPLLQFFKIEWNIATCENSRNVLNLGDYVLTFTLKESQFCCRSKIDFNVLF